MATNADSEKLLSTLQDLLIVQLWQTGLGNNEIRQIAGVAQERVARLTKHLNKAKRKANR
jgi:hypothetical protein